MSEQLNLCSPPLVVIASLVCGYLEAIHVQRFAIFFDLQFCVCLVSPPPLVFCNVSILEIEVFLSGVNSEEHKYKVTSIHSEEVFDF